MSMKNITKDQERHVSWKSMLPDIVSIALPKPEATQEKRYFCETCGYPAYRNDDGSFNSHDLPQGRTYQQQKDEFPDCWNRPKIDTAEPQEATGTSCEVFIPLGSPGISWERPAPGTRPDIVGVRHLDDGSTEYLMHNEALCDPYYVGISPDAEPLATTQGDEEPCHCGEHACVGTDRIRHPFFCKRMREPKPAPLGEVSELERKCLYRVSELTAQLSQVQAPLLQKIAQLTAEIRHHEEAPFYTREIFVNNGQMDGKDFSSVTENDFRNLFEYSEVCECQPCAEIRYILSLRARIAELESAQPKAEKVQKLVKDAVLADIVKNDSSSQYLYYQLAKVSPARGKAGAMNDTKFAPFQSNVRRPLIPWDVHLAAYEVYCEIFRPQEALVDLEGRNCRGGFGTRELLAFLYARSFPRKDWDTKFHEALKEQR